MRFLNLCFTLLLPLALFLSACELQVIEDPTPIDPPPPPIDYNVLPPATQEGLNTFGCKINGKVWVPRVLPYGITIRDIDVLVSEKNMTGGVAITCTLVDPSLGLDEWMSMSGGKTYFKPGTRCGSDEHVSLLYRSDDGQRFSSTYHLNDSNCVTITKIDTINNIISGTFKFTVHRDSINLNDKIEITDGRFDLKYYPQ